MNSSNALLEPLPRMHLPGGETAAADRGARPRPAPLRCFLVEDNPVIRQNLSATLEELLTIQVIGTADDEAGALRWLRSPGVPCDLIIIDLFLKGGSGFGVLDRARELQPELHRVVLSNYATPDIRRRCLALGAERVFDKSAELEDLLEHCELLGAVPR